MCALALASPHITALTVEAMGALGLAHNAAKEAGGLSEFGAGACAFCRRPVLFVDAIGCAWRCVGVAC